MRTHEIVTKDARESAVVRLNPLVGLVVVLGPPRLRNITGCNPAVSSLGMREMSGRRAVSPVMRARARSMDAPVSGVQFDAPEKAMVVATPVSLVSSAEQVVVAFTFLQTGWSCAVGCESNTYLGVP